MSIWKTDKIARKISSQLFVQLPQNKLSCLAVQLPGSICPWEAQARRTYMADTHIRVINRPIIDPSNLHSIILCRINAERMSVLASLSFKKITLTIGKVLLEAFLQIEQYMVLRVYLKHVAQENSPTRIFQYSKEQIELYSYSHIQRQFGSDGRYGSHFIFTAWYSVL